MYPFDELFKENVWQEAVQQICRLRNHPSLALWCGNNESDEGWHNWGGWQNNITSQKKIPLQYGQGTIRFFINFCQKRFKNMTVKGIIYPHHPFMGGGRKESLFEGDAHYWGVWWENNLLISTTKKFRDL